MTSHTCIDCKKYIIAPNPNEVMCKCDFKTIVTKEKLKPLQVSKEVHGFIQYMVNREELINWCNNNEKSTI